MKCADCTVQQYNIGKQDEATITNTGLEGNRPSIQGHRIIIKDSNLGNEPLKTQQMHGNALRPK